MRETNCLGAGVASLCVLCLASAPMSTAAQDRVSSVDLVQVQLNLPGKITPGKSFIVLDEVENTGDQAAPRSVTGFCLSGDDVCDERDLRLGVRRVPPLRGRESHAMQTALKLPADVPPGPYYVIAIADATQAVVERYKTNNTRATKTVVVDARR